MKAAVCAMPLYEFLGRNATLKFPAGFPLSIVSASVLPQPGRLLACPALDGMASSRRNLGFSA